MPVGNAAAVAVEFPFPPCEDLPVRKAGKKFPAFPGIVVPVGIRGNRDIGFLDENVGGYGAAGPDMFFVVGKDFIPKPGRDMMEHPGTVNNVKGLLHPELLQVGAKEIYFHMLAGSQLPAEISCTS